MASIGIDIGIDLLAKQVLVLGIDLKHSGVLVLVLGIDLGPLEVLVLVLSFYKLVLLTCVGHAISSRYSCTVQSHRLEH